jgi:hypothetical protein
MAKAIPDAILDLMLDQAEGDRLCVCSAQPTTYTEAITTYKLAIVTIDSGDYTAANGDTSGRKNTIGAQNGVTIDSNGDATHVAVANSGDSSLRLVTTCTTQTLTAGGTVDIGTFKHELADPS